MSSSALLLVVASGKLTAARQSFSSPIRPENSVGEVLLCQMVLSQAANLSRVASGFRELTSLAHRDRPACPRAAGAQMSAGQHRRYCNILYLDVGVCFHFKGSLPCWCQMQLSKNTPSQVEVLHEKFYSSISTEVLQYTQSIRVKVFLKSLWLVSDCVWLRCNNPDASMHKQHIIVGAHFKYLIYS